VLPLKKERAIRHPTDNTIELFASGRLSDRAVRRIELHLLVCEACLERLTLESGFGEMMRALRVEGAQVESVGAAFAGLAPILQFRTHLPVYSLAAAAGVFSEQQTEINPEGWVAVPSGPVLLTRDMFVICVRGRSMEPVIPDGTLCAFRSQVSGTCDGKIVLLEDYSKTGGNRYSVKRYRSSSQPDPIRQGDPAWLHERITLESINPDYRPAEIPSDRKVNVIGEFVFIVP
jgi:SOS-response transcriptional repressor LexA